MKRLLFFQQQSEDRLWLRALSTLDENYRVDAAAQEEEAIRLLEQQSYSLLILSLQTPTEETVGILERFCPESLPQPPRVVLLASSTDPELPKLFPGTFCTILQMPMTLRRLLDRLRALAELPALPSAEQLRQKWKTGCAQYALDGDSPGTVYLREVALGHFQNPALPLRVLYGRIAQKYHATPTQVERSVGYGLRRLWKPPLPPKKPAARDAIALLCQMIFEGRPVGDGKPDEGDSADAARCLCR